MKAGFDVRTQGLELTFDPSTQQQFLSFQFAVQVSIPQLLQELMRFQRVDGVPDSSKTPVLQGFPRARGSVAMRPREVGCGAGVMSAASACEPPVIPSVSATTAPASAVECGLTVNKPTREQALPAVLANVGVGANLNVQTTATGSAKDEAWSQHSHLGHPSSTGPGATSQAITTTVPVESALSAPARHAENVKVLAMEIAKPDDIVQAVLQGDVTEIRAAIIQGANIAKPLGGSSGSLLHMAIKAGGRIDVVNLLIQGKCDVDGAGADGKTPLLVAISKDSRLSPMVARLLLNAHADPAAQVGPKSVLDCVKEMARESAHDAPARQLAEEVLERPTLGVGVIEHEQVLGACFADMSNDKIAFYTESIVGFFSLEQKRVFLKQKLSQQRVHSVVRHMAVNPQLGTIAVFVEVSGTNRVQNNQFQNLLIIWPTGQLQEEEPLKISVDSSIPMDGVMLPPAIVGSTSRAPLTLVGRLCGGKVLCWHLNSACSQLVSQRELVGNGGLIAISGDGCWVAVVDLGSTDGNQVELWTFEGHRKAKRVLRLARRPQCMAIMQQPQPALLDDADTDTSIAVTARLALAEVADGGIAEVIEVLQVNVDGTTSVTYRVTAQSPCRLLSFCHESADYLLSGHLDGLVVLCNLASGQSCLSHDDVEVRSAHTSVDRSLIVTAVAECFRVYRPSAPGGSP